MFDGLLSYSSNQRQSKVIDYSWGLVSEGVGFGTRGHMQSRRGIFEHNITLYDRNFTQNAVSLVCG